MSPPALAQKSSILSYDDEDEDDEEEDSDIFGESDREDGDGDATVSPFQPHDDFILDIVSENKNCSTSVRK